MKPSTERPNLDEHDFKTLRELYSQAQIWVRHYETMIVSTNVLLVSAASMFAGLALRGGNPKVKSVMLFGVPVLMSIVGVFLTRMLFKLYAIHVQRLIAYEDTFNCYAPLKVPSLPWGGSFLPGQLMTLPVKMPASGRFFLVLHAILVVTYATLAFSIQ